MDSPAPAAIALIHEQDAGSGGATSLPLLLRCEGRSSEYWLQLSMTLFGLFILLFLFLLLVPLDSNRFFWCTLLLMHALRRVYWQHRGVIRNGRHDSETLHGQGIRTNLAEEATPASPRIGVANWKGETCVVSKLRSRDTY